MTNGIFDLSNDIFEIIFDYEQKKKWLYSAFESYKTEPPDSFKRVFIDRLINLSRLSAVTAEDKKYHNIIALRYIAEPTLSKSKICKTLHLGWLNYESITEKALNRLMVLAFGVDGIDWNGSAEDIDQEPYAEYEDI